MPRNHVSTSLSASDKGVDTANRPSPVGLSTAIERCAVLQLRNPFLWLGVAIPLYLSLYLTFLQWRFEGFEHLELMSHLTALIEAGILCSVCILAANSAKYSQIWQRLYPNTKYQDIAAHLSASLLIVLVAVVELLPTLIFHQYPQLKSADQAISINIPLMVLQRSVLIMALGLITYNVIVLLRIYLRVPIALALLIGLVWHTGIGYYITYLSYSVERFASLNDVFYYNQLWHYIDGFPKLQINTVFHNLQWSVFFYLAVGLLVWAVTLLLIYPKSLMLSAPQSRKK